MVNVRRRTMTVWRRSLPRRTSRFPDFRPGCNNQKKRICFILKVHLRLPHKSEESRHQASHIYPTVRYALPYLHMDSKGLFSPCLNVCLLWQISFPCCVCELTHTSVPFVSPVVITSSNIRLATENVKRVVFLIVAMGLPPATGKNFLRETAKGTKVILCCETLIPV